MDTKNDDQASNDPTETPSADGAELGARNCSPDAFPSLVAWWNHNDKFATDYRSPEEKAALDAMYAQHDALRKLGWQDAIYCPKDGRQFLAITAGSTGVFRAHYDGEWPTGTWWLQDGGDLWPSRPILWKPIPANAKVEARRKSASDQPED